MQATRTRRSVRITILAWITILLLTGVFQFYRGAIPDSIVFLAMAAALIVGETGILNRFDGRRWHPRRIVVLGAVVIAAGVLVLTPRHGLADGVVVAVSGALVFLVVWPNTPGDSEPDPWSDRLTRSAIAWAILGIAFCLWELGMYFLGLNASGRTEFPALSDLLDPVFNNPIGRLLAVVAWLAGGVALARRGRTTE